MVFDGKAYADTLLQKLKKKVGKMNTPPHLAVIYFGGDQSRYVSQKEKLADLCGINISTFALKQDLSTPEVREKISVIAQNADHTAIIVQLPLPEQIDVSVLDSIPPEKDPDVLSASSIGTFFNGTLSITPPTPQAVMAVIKESGAELNGARVCLFGHGKLVGRFLVPILLQEQATVSIAAHPQKKEDMQTFCKNADIIISATGDGQFLPASILPKDSVVIDAGFSVLDGGVVGDIHFDVSRDTFSFVSPVPGGIGPIGIAMLFRNCIQLVKNNSLRGTGFEHK